ncbi:tRNA pseudouridine38-40 synthase [Pacificibacter maritimus]|uniref:tRNA pseudouridine synthase A n=1 Tax=Pacificibacter maritimus TaxID=762213 RepID=A0A3N4UIP0_9RHOB|nr:tRNA pseudouridine(38-40) synthase TruA [Pacificibacter maritimus]RPE67119.1 tRNA pseudouridine38-40 synthase [Pacificibacter maritimus]
MPRFALLIEYNGAPFSGWQRQKDHPSVQQCVEEALRKIDPDCPTIGAAGRTDAGVHAKGQVAHCDLKRDWEPFRLMEAVNFHLKPNPIAILDAVPMPDDWHARYAAYERRYTFHLIARRAPAAHAAGLAWQVRGPLDLAAMQEGAKRLLGTHDFTTFRSTMCQAQSPVKTMDEITIEEHDYSYGKEFRFHLRARSFLHNQVRSIVGSLERVGGGHWAPEKITEVLEARDRNACGPVTPPDGLFMTGVGYKEKPFGF